MLKVLYPVIGVMFGLRGDCMNQKVVTGDCLNCESTFELNYFKEYASAELPQYCPFCGEMIEDVNEEYIDEEEDYGDDGDWDNN